MTIMNKIIFFTLFVLLTHHCISQERSYTTQIISFGRKVSENKWEWNKPEKQVIQIKISNKYLTLGDDKNSHYEINDLIESKAIKHKSGTNGNAIGFKAIDDNLKKCTLEINYWEDGVVVFMLKYNDTIFKYICSSDTN